MWARLIFSDDGCTATSDPVQGTTALHQCAWSTPGAPGALISTHVVCGAIGDVPHHPVLAQVPADCLPILAQQQLLPHCGRGCRSGWLYLKSWKQQLCSTSGALQHPERVLGVPCITGTYSRLWVFMKRLVLCLFFLHFVSCSREGSYRRQLSWLGNLVVPLARWAPQTWPSLHSDCRMGTRKKRKIKTSEQTCALWFEKGTVKHYSGFFWCTLSIVDFLPALVRIGFLPIPFSFRPFPTPSSAVELEGAIHFSPG